MLLSVCLLVLGLIYVMTKDFVVPQMALENLERDGGRAQVAVLVQRLRKAAMPATSG